MINLEDLKKYMNDPLFCSIIKATHAGFHAYLQEVLVKLTSSIGLNFKALGVDNKYLENITKELIVNLLAKLSGKENWKSYQKGSVFLLEDPSPSVISGLANKLSSLELFKVEKTRRSDNQTPVLKITNVNLTKLL